VASAIRRAAQRHDPLERGVEIQPVHLALPVDGTKVADRARLLVRSRVFKFAQEEQTVRGQPRVNTRHEVDNAASVLAGAIGRADQHATLPEVLEAVRRCSVRVCVPVDAAAVDGSMIGRWRRGKPHLLKHHDALKGRHWVRVRIAIVAMLQQMHLCGEHAHRNSIIRVCALVKPALGLDQPASDFGELTGVGHDFGLG